MEKHMYRHAALLLVALLVFQGCRREIFPAPETVRELPDIVLRAREWIREHETLSHGQELEIETLDFQWEKHALDSNSLGQAIVSIPVRVSDQARGEYAELAFGVDDEGVPHGMVKRYTGDAADQRVYLHIYTITGQKAMTGVYYPATGKLSPRFARGGIVKLAKAPSVEETTVDGGTIEEVYVTAKGSSSSGGGGFGHWGSPGWGSFGGGGSGSGGFGFDSGVNPILIEPVHVSAHRKRGHSGGMSFPVFHRVEDFFVGNYGYGTPSPYYISVNFNCAGKGINATLRSNVEKTLNNLKDGKVGRSDYNCFPSGILKAVQNKQGANGVLKFCLKEAGSGASGTYSPATKTVGYIYDYVHDMSTLHEILHYYQDLSGALSQHEEHGKRPGR